MKRHLFLAFPLALGATFFACGVDHSNNPPGDWDGGSWSGSSGSGGSGSSSGVFVGSGTGGGSSSGGTWSGSSSGSSADDSGPPPPAPAALVLAHTAPGVPPFRVCFGTVNAGGSPSVVPISALPDAPGAAPAYPGTGPFPGVTAGTPGIYPGTIGAFPEITDLSAITLVPFVVLASSIANDVNFDGGAGIDTADGGAEESCVQLIGSHGLGVADTSAGSVPGRLTAGADFFQLSTIPAGTLLDENTYLLTLNGCLPDGTPGAAVGLPQTITCGPDYDGGSNASLGVVQLDTTTVPGGGTIGVQFAHRSTAIENTTLEACGNPTCTAIVELHTAATDGVSPAFLQYETIPSDGGAAYVPVTVNPSAGPIKYSGSGLAPISAASLPINLVGPAANPTLFGALVQPLDGGAPNALPWPGTPPATGDALALPLAEIQQLSSWNATTTSAPAGFQLGQTYTFLLVGDPAAAQLANPDGGSGINPQWDGRGVHVLAFPNVFTPKSL